MLENHSPWPQHPEPASRGAWGPALACMFLISSLRGGGLVCSVPLGGGDAGGGPHPCTGRALLKRLQLSLQHMQHLQNSSQAALGLPVNRPGSLSASRAGSRGAAVAITMDTCSARSAVSAKKRHIAADRQCLVLIQNPGACRRPGFLYVCGVGTRGRGCATMPKGQAGGNLENTQPPAGTAGRASCNAWRSNCVFFQTAVDHGIALLVAPGLWEPIGRRCVGVLAACSSRATMVAARSHHALLHAGCRSPAGAVGLQWAAERPPGRCQRPGYPVSALGLIKCSWSGRETEGGGATEGNGTAATACLPAACVH